MLPVKVPPVTFKAPLPIRQDEGIANSIQADLFGGDRSTDTAITETVLSLGGELVDCTIEKKNKRVIQN